jgi:hypothetical protein
VIHQIEVTKANWHNKLVHKKGETDFKGSKFSVTILKQNQFSSQKRELILKIATK